MYTGSLSIHLCLLRQCLSFLVYRSFTSLKYFILFDAIVNVIVFFVSFPESPLYVYRNATDFYRLILYPAIVLDLLISSNRFLVGSLGSYMGIHDHVICKQRQFYFCLSALEPYYFFFSPSCSD